MENADAITAYSPRWPAQLAEWMAALAPAATPNDPSATRERAWLLLHDVLHGFFRLHARNFRGASDEDVDDLAAQKALDLITRAERGEWSLAGRRSGEIVTYLSTVARNGLVDHLRERGRYVEVDPDVETGDAAAAAPVSEEPDCAIESREFAAHLRACFETLDGRSKIVWFLRVFFDFASRDIADHPRVRLERGHVDVILQRARNALKRCMERKGHVVKDAPAGAFVEVWRAMRELEKP